MGKEGSIIAGNSSDDGTECGIVDCRLIRSSKSGDSSSSMPKVRTAWLPSQSWRVSDFQISWLGRLPSRKVSPSKQAERILFFLDVRYLLGRRLSSVSALYPTQITLWKMECTCLPSADCLSIAVVKIMLSLCCTIWNAMLELWRVLSELGRGWSLENIAWRISDVDITSKSCT